MRRESLEPSAAAIRSSVERGDPFAVLPLIRLGDPDSPTYPSTLPAGADEAVADDLQRVAAEPLVEAVHTDGDYARAMEHERQSRLRRWQEQR